MNWEDYLDPYLNKQEYWSNAPASEPTIRMPRQSDYPVDTLRAPDRTLGDWFGDLLFPETREYVATGQGKPGMVGEWADSIGGKIGSLAKMGFAASKGIPALAGMVEMGGKKYPNWFYHRTASAEDEWSWWNKLFQRGLSTEKPASLFNPQTYPVAFDAYGEGPGLLFNTKEENIRSLGWRDFWSEPTIFTRNRDIDDDGFLFRNYIRKEEAIPQMKKWLSYKLGAEGEDWFDNGIPLLYSRFKAKNPTDNEIASLLTEKANKMLFKITKKKTGNFLSGKYDDMAFPEKWVPTETERLINSSDPSIEHIMRKLLVAGKRDGYRHKPIVDESIINAGRKDLAGVRLSPNRSTELDDMARMFADKHGVPVYETDTIKTKEEQQKAIRDLLQHGVNNWWLE